MSVITHWVEIQTFTLRNGPELNETSSEEIPNGRYVPVGEVERVRQRLEGVVARADRLAAELKSIADEDPVNLMLDPTWPQRVAREALGLAGGR